MDDAEIMEGFDRISEKIVDAIEAHTTQQMEILMRLERAILALGGLTIYGDD